jgi:hypothetical protein
VTWDSAAAYGLGITLGALCFFVFGCASSPDTLILVDKSVHVHDVCEVEFSYESNSDVESEAQLEGTIAPNTDLKLK